MKSINTKIDCITKKKYCNILLISPSDLRTLRAAITSNKFQNVVNTNTTNMKDKHHHSIHMFHLLHYPIRVKYQKQQMRIKRSFRTSITPYTLKVICEMKVLMANHAHKKLMSNNSM